MAAVVGLAVLIRAAEDIFYDEVLLGLVFDSPLPLPLAMGVGVGVWISIRPIPA